MGIVPVNSIESKVPVRPVEERMVYVPGTAFEARSISKIPASDADPITETKEVPPALISIWTRLPRALTSAELRIKLPRVSVLPASGAIVPELTETAPVKVPCPLKLPLCALKLLSLQTEMLA